jgi:hypothetical protein
MLVGQQQPFSATGNSVTALCLRRTSPYHAILKNRARARENDIFPRRLFKTNHKQLQTFSIDFD